MSYTDQWSRYHEKPTNGVDPSSNNGWIYTAIGMALGMEVDIIKLIKCAKACKTTYFYMRSPKKALPPMGRDEAIGMVSCRAIDPNEIINRNYYINNLGDPNKASLWTKIKLYWANRKSHRNWVWNVQEIWGIAFTLPIQDQYYIDFMANKKAPFKFIYFYLSSLTTIYKKPKKPSEFGGKNILMVKLRDMGMEKSFLYRKLNIKENINGYFESNHPFVKRVNETL